MGKALTSASNPGEPGDPWANTGGDQRQNAKSLQRGRVKGRGRGHTKTRPAHGAEFLQDEKTAGACGPLGRGGRREVREAHGAHAASGWDPAGPGAAQPAPLGTHRHQSRRCGTRTPARSHPRCPARVPRVPRYGPCRAWRGACPHSPPRGAPPAPWDSQPSLPDDLQPDVS